MKVDFIICGTQKGGTTALDAYLRQHPRICMANCKEVHFFDDESNFQAEKIDYSKYHAAFDIQAHGKLYGEATPIYMYWRDAPKRIWQYNPNIKLIVTLRNPIERAYSHWNMERQRNAETLSFGDALKFESVRRREQLPYQHRVFSYVDRGFYSEQLRRLWAYFDEKQVLVLKHEDLKLKPRETLNSVCDFLGIERMTRLDPHEVHIGEYASQIGEKEKELLRYIYEYEIRGLERLLGWDCNSWLARQCF